MTMDVVPVPEPKVVKNTATVSATNTDTHTGNNSSTASTLLTAH